MSDPAIEKIKQMLREHGQYPQGLEELGIRGRRDSDKRYAMYGLKQHITPDMDVLDIGCNCGFFSCLLAQQARTVTGFDKDRLLIDVAIATATILNLQNISFFKDDFNEYQAPKRYDLVIASQIHFWVKIPFAAYVEKLTTMVKPDGMLLFESHDTDNVDWDIDDKIKILQAYGFSIQYFGKWVEDPGQYWIPPKQHKKIPRQYYLMRYINEHG